MGTKVVHNYYWAEFTFDAYPGVKFRAKRDNRFASGVWVEAWDSDERNWERVTLTDAVKQARRILRVSTFWPEGGSKWA